MSKFDRKSKKRWREQGRKRQQVNTEMNKLFASPGKSQVKMGEFVAAIFRTILIDAEREAEKKRWKDEK